MAAWLEEGSTASVARPVAFGSSSNVRDAVNVILSSSDNGEFEWLAWTEWQALRAAAAKFRARLSEPAVGNVRDSPWGPPMVPVAWSAETSVAEELPARSGLAVPPPPAAASTVLEAVALSPSWLPHDKKPEGGVIEISTSGGEYKIQLFCTKCLNTAESPEGTGSFPYDWARSQGWGTPRSGTGKWRRVTCSCTKW